MDGEVLGGLKSFFDSLRDGVCVADTRGRVLYANAAVCAILDIPASDLEKRPVCELVCANLEGVHGEAAASCPLRAPGDGDAVTFKGREHRTHRDLRVRCLRAQVEGKERHFLLIEDASAEAELERNQEEWRQMLAHDLRVPLTIVLGVLRELEDRGHGYALSKPDHEMLGMGARACVRMEALIDSYLESARLKSGIVPLQLGRIDAGRLILDCVAEQSEEARARGLELTAVAPDGLWARGDSQLLRRALMNLLGNALKFTPAKGRVRVSGSSSRGSVSIQVVDTGPGIPESDLPRIFERFFQGRNGKRGGLGLGLTFCSAAMLAMGGEVSVKSKTGAGSAFTLKLPADGGPS